MFSQIVIWLAILGLLVICVLLGRYAFLNIIELKSLIKQQKQLNKIQESLETIADLEKSGIDVKKSMKIKVRKQWAEYFSSHYP